MNNGVLAIAQAVGTMATVGIDAQTTTALWLIHVVVSNFKLTESHTEQLAKDQEIYFKDSLTVDSDHPERSAQTAADYQIYVNDSSKMDRETGYQNTLIQNEKGQVRSLGNSLENVYGLEGPIEQILNQTSHLLLGF